MIEVQGETEFLTRILTKHGAPEQQKYILALRSAETDDEILGRAVWRMVWIMLGVSLVYWAGSVVAFSLPAVILTLSGKILAVLFIASAASFLVFSLYRVRVRKHLHREIQKCRQMLESALALTLNFNSALLLMQQETDALHCSRCQRDLLGEGIPGFQDRLLPIQTEQSIKKPPVFPRRPVLNPKPGVIASQ